MQQPCSIGQRGCPPGSPPRRTSFWSSSAKQLQNSRFSKRSPSLRPCSCRAEKRGTSSRVHALDRGCGHHPQARWQVACYLRGAVPAERRAAGVRHGLHVGCRLQPVLQPAAPDGRPAHLRHQHTLLGFRHDGCAVLRDALGHLRSRGGAKGRGARKAAWRLHRRTASRAGVCSPAQLNTQQGFRKRPLREGFRPGGSFAPGTLCHGGASPGVLRIARPKVFGRHAS